MKGCRAQPPRPEATSDAVYVQGKKPITAIAFTLPMGSWSLALTLVRVHATRILLDRKTRV
jgi:hypothetical protein